jgi:hypothetical protein
MSEMVKLTATVSGEKRSVVLPRELWEREIALIVNKYSQGNGVSEVHTSVKDIQIDSERVRDAFCDNNQPERSASTGIFIMDTKQG